MKKITVSILTTLLMLSMVFSSSVFAANEEVSAWDSFLGLLGINASETTDVVGVEYRGHIQNKGDYPLDPATWVQGPNRLGTVGEALRLEGFWIQLTDKPADVNIKYQVHVQNEGWMEPVLNGKFAGTEGKSQRIEAIKIWLVDDAGEPVTGYSVEYRGHVENVGDVPQTAGDWYADGAQLGTVGASQRLEALEVKIVKTKADMTAYDAAVVAAAELTEDDYTAESWEVLTDALAVEVTADNTQAEVDAATAAIEIATGALVFANQADLDAAKLAVADLVEADYTAESWAAIAPALELPETTNAEVGAKALALGTAYADLVFAGQADLDAVVAEAATKTEADYTPATWAALAEALELPETTNAEVVAKTAAITEAIAGLVEVANMEAYDAIVAAAGEVVEADYTAATYAALQTALEENVVTNLDTQEDVDAATAAITAAYDGLVKILKLESVEATGAKILTVKFNQEVVDASKAVFEVKKGSVKVNTSSITWNTDNTEAAIVLSGKLSAGEYTVNVTGLQTTPLTGKVTAANETVAKVTILSENAPILSSVSGSGTATVGYKVENQYGEDITATTALTATAGGAVVRTGTASTAVKGVVTIPITDTAKEGDAIVLTLVHTESGKADSKTLKISAKSAVSDIAITALYNKDGKTLTETSDLTKDNFYLLVEAKDQYGQVLKTANIIGLIANNTNTTIAQINGNANPTLETITVDGTEVPAVKITNGSTGVLKAGSTSIMLIAPASGKNTSFTVDVAEAQRVDTISFEVPSVVAAKEALFIPIQATDKLGSAVTDEKVLKDANRGVKLSGITDAAFTTKDGVLGVSVPANSASLAAEGYVSLVGITSTNKTTIANIQVKAQAVPVILTGLTSTTSTTLRTTTGSLGLTTTNIVAEDQYGRVMTKAALDSWLGANAANKILVADTTATIVSLSSPAEVRTDNATVTVTAGTTKGTEKVTLTVANAANPAGLATSAKEITFQVTDGTEFASYTVDAIGTVYDSTTGGTYDTAYDKTVKVYGVLSNGSKVLLTNATDYTVTSTNSQLNTDLSNGVIEISTGYTYPTGVNEVKLPITVTVNASGEKLNQEITISKVVPDVKKIEIVENGTAANTTMTAVSTITYDATGGAFNFGKLAAAVDVVVTDQYGVKTELTAANTTFPDGTAIVNALTFSKVAGENVFTGNGTGAAAVTEMPTDSIFNTVVNSGTLSSTPLRVVVDNSYSADGLALAAANVNHTVAIPFTENTAELAKAKATADITSALDAIPAAAGVSFTITDESFTAAVGGGATGTYSFKVIYTIGTHSVTSSTFTVTIPNA